MVGTDVPKIREGLGGNGGGWGDHELLILTKGVVGSDWGAGVYTGLREEITTPKALLSNASALQQNPESSLLGLV